MKDKTFMYYVLNHEDRLKNQLKTSQGVESLMRADSEVTQQIGAEYVHNNLAALQGNTSDARAKRFLQSYADSYDGAGRIAEATGKATAAGTRATNAATNAAAAIYRGSSPGSQAAHTGAAQGAYNTVFTSALASGLTPSQAAAQTLKEKGGLRYCGRKSGGASAEQAAYAQRLELPIGQEPQILPWKTVDAGGVASSTAEELLISSC